jgi:hypothetical protein
VGEGTVPARVKSNAPSQLLPPRIPRFAAGLTFGAGCCAGLFLGRAIRFSLGVTGQLADGLLDGASYPLGRVINLIVVYNVAF